MAQLRTARRCFKTKSTSASAQGSFLDVAENSKPRCQICRKPTSANAGTIGELLRPSLLEFIQKRTPEFDPKGVICFNDLGKFRRDYVKEVLQDEIGELSTLDQEVIDSLQEHEILSENIGKEFEKELTFGERLSDRIASFGGSWPFIIIFGAVLAIWIAINTVVLATRAFDPYPFILMNLILSCLAAIQAPIIMMSQNRSEDRDRARAENDYKVNLKAELEIRHLHEKIDHLLRKQYNRLFEIQQIQIELLEELGQRRRGGSRQGHVAASGQVTTPDATPDEDAPLNA
jgi:uncharacterized membrane protein